MRIVIIIGNFRNCLIYPLHRPNRYRGTYLLCFCEFIVPRDGVFLVISLVFRFAGSCGLGQGYGFVTWVMPRVTGVSMDLDLLKN